MLLMPSTKITHRTSAAFNSSQPAQLNLTQMNPVTSAWPRLPCTKRKKNVVLQKELDGTKFPTHAKPDRWVLKVKHRMSGMKSSVLTSCAGFKPLQTPRQRAGSEMLEFTTGLGAIWRFLQLLPQSRDTSDLQNPSGSLGLDQWYGIQSLGNLRDLRNGNSASHCTACTNQATFSNQLTK